MGFFSDILRIFGGADDDYSKNLDDYHQSGVPSGSPVEKKPEKRRSPWSFFRKEPLPDDIYHRRLNLKPSSVFFLVKEIENGRAYTEKSIPREGKSPRVLSVPSPFLKNVQRRILKQILEDIELHPAAHGFARKRSIFSAVEPHAGQRVVVTIDIRNFFDSITAKRVCGMFKANGFDNKDAATLTKLCVYQGRLPQGAPTSPAIANIICKRLDSRLSGLASKNGFSYTRYADDLIFSGTGRMIRFIPIFGKIVADEGFETADEKFRIMRSGSRQRVLGLNLNTKVSVPRNVRRVIRAMVHKQFKSDFPDEDMLSFLYGHVGMMAKTHASQARKLKRRLNKARKKL